MRWCARDPRSIHRVRGGLIYEEPKTRRSQRTLELPLPLVAMLHEHKAAQTGEQMQAGSEWHDEDLVFAQPGLTKVSASLPVPASGALGVIPASGVQELRLGGAFELSAATPAQAYTGSLTVTVSYN